MNSNSLSFNVGSWNVRGLGDPLKCDLVKNLLINNNFDLILLQESKLDTCNIFKSKTFLPSNLQSLNSVPSQGASGGIITAWDERKLKLTSASSRRYSLTTTLELELLGTSITVTNVYGPNADADRPSFFQELHSFPKLSATVPG